MDTVHFDNEALPVYIRSESCEDGTAHSEIAHFHDNIELILIERGSIVCGAGGQDFHLYKGDVCFINRRQLHRLYPDTAEGGCGQTVMIVGSAALSQNEAVYGRFIRPMLEDATFSHVRFEGADSPAGRIAELMERARALTERRDHGYELELIALVLQIFRQLSIAYVSGPKPGPVDGNALVQQRMAEFIYENYDRPLSLDDIAASGSVSRSQCTKLFRRYTGLSPIAYLNSHRLELCRDRLRNTPDTIADVAASCGFSDQSYMSRLFLREYGVTPMAYRKSTLGFWL